MALQNGVLVHGPTSWAAAVRDEHDEIRVAHGRKRRIAPGVNLPFLRGPLRLAESFVVLPDVRRALPQARFPFERPTIAVAMVASSLVASAARRSKLPALPREAVAAVAALVPSALALRGGELASYHGAEHVSIGTYETGEPTPKEHDRCGSHLIGPMLVASAATTALVQKVPTEHRKAAQVAGALGAVGVAVEVFAWTGRHPGSRVARLLMRPGYELQHRLATADPSPAQLEVAEAALAACLAAEGEAASARA
jgi:uncharacterized protein YqhQ